MTPQPEVGAQRAEHGVAADRFAREIVRILAGSEARSRRLMGIPFGAAHHCNSCPIVPIKHIVRMACFQRCRV
jgi:hypothetical protein